MRVTSGGDGEGTGAVVDATGGCALVVALAVVVLPTVDHHNMHSTWYRILSDLNNDIKIVACIDNKKALRTSVAFARLFQLV